ncbi:MAG: DUF4347 domain-containing protein, partial [bacterium]|nr:DUF4347 domain-containing protein [bacterium]
MANGFDVTYGDFADDMLLPRNGDPDDIPEEEAFAGQGDDMLELWCEEDELTTVIDAAPDAVGKNLRQELVLVDTATDDYQQLVDGLLNQADESRHLEVVLLDNERNGIDQISETVLAYQDLDAIHLISHGSDGAVNIGNTALNAETLEQNSIKIGAWSEAFSKEGDFLIYGCNLAETADGQSLVNNLSKLTGTDVAASDDLTGHASLGGNWDLEYTQGQIEAETLIDQDTADQWLGLLAPPTAADNTVSTHEDTTYTFAANDFGYSDADGDAMVSVKITTLEAVGALQLNSVDVTLNQVITKADID